MVKCILFFIFINAAGVNTSFGQDIRCKLLTALLQNKNVKKVWLIDDYPDMPIVFVDTKNFVHDCVLPNYQGRKVELIRDSSSLEKKWISYLILKYFQEDRGKFRVVVYQANTNALVDAELKRNGDKIVVSKLKIGHF